MKTTNTITTCDLCGSDNKHFTGFRPVQGFVDIQCGFELRVVPFGQGIQDICRDCVVKALIEKVEKLK